jgi:hypothetical protein
LGNLWFCPYDSWWDLWVEGLGMRFHKENHEISKECIQSDLIQVWTNRKCYVYETLFFKSTPLLPSPLLAAGTVYSIKSCTLSCVEIVNFINSCLFLVLLFKLHQNLHWGPRVPAAAIPLKHHLKDETFHSADCLPWGWGCGQTDLTWSAKLLWRSSQQEVFCHVCSAPITPEMLILETQISIPRKYCILVLPPGMTCFSCSVSAD